MDPNALVAAPADLSSLPPNVLAAMGFAAAEGPPAPAASQSPTAPEGLENLSPSVLKAMGFSPPEVQGPPASAKEPEKAAEEEPAPDSDIEKAVRLYDLSRKAGEEEEQIRLRQQAQGAPSARGSRSWKETPHPDKTPLTARVDFEAEKTGMTDAQISVAMEDGRKLDFGQGHESALLSNGVVVVKPALAENKAAWEKAVKAAGGTPEAQKRALAEREPMWAGIAEGYYDLLQKTDKFTDFEKENPKLSVPDLVKKFRAENDGFFSNSGTQQKLAVEGGFTDIGTQVLGTAASLFPGGTIELAAKLNRTKGEEIAQLSDALNGGAWAGKFTRTAASIIPAMAAGGGAGIIASRLGAAGATSAVALGASGVAAGVQTYGSTYLDARQAYLDKGLTEDEARKAAIGPALLGGITTALLTMTFSGGMEKFVTSAGKRGAQAGVRGALKTRFVEALKASGKGFADEAVEEGLDQFFQGVYAANSYDPDKSMESIVAEGFEAFLLGGLLGLGGGVVGAGSNEVQLRRDAAATRASVARMLDAQHSEPNMVKAAAVQLKVLADLSPGARAAALDIYAATTPAADAAQALRATAPASADEAMKAVQDDVAARVETHFFSDDVVTRTAANANGTTTTVTAPAATNPPPATTSAATPVPGAQVPAYQYAVNEDPGAAPLPGQIGDRNVDSLEYNFGTATLAQKLTEDEAKKLGLTFLAETKIAPAPVVTPAAPVVTPAAPVVTPAPVAKPTSKTGKKAAPATIPAVVPVSSEWTPALVDKTWRAKNAATGETRGRFGTESDAQGYINQYLPGQPAGFKAEKTEGGEPKNEKTKSQAIEVKGAKSSVQVTPPVDDQKQGEQKEVAPSPQPAVAKKDADAAKAAAAQKAADAAQKAEASEVAKAKAREAKAAAKTATEKAAAEKVFAAAAVKAQADAALAVSTKVAEEEEAAAPAEADAALAEKSETERFKFSETPLPETTEGWLTMREERRQVEIGLLEREIGVSREQAERIHQIVIVSGKEGNAWAKKHLTPEQQAGFESFWDESPYNVIGGPVDFWNYDPEFNPENVEGETSPEGLAQDLVSAFTNGLAESPSDKWVWAVAAARKLLDLGATKRDISNALKAQAGRLSGSSSDAEFWFRTRGGEINAFLARFVPDMAMDKAALAPAIPSAKVETPKLEAPKVEPPVVEPKPAPKRAKAPRAGKKVIAVNEEAKEEPEPAEKEEETTIPPSGKAWVESHFFAYAHPDTIFATLRERRMLEPAARRSAEAVRREREKLGRSLGDPAFTHAEVKNTYFAALRAATSGRGLDVPKLDFILEEVATQFEKMAAKDPNGHPMPLSRFLDKDGKPKRSGYGVFLGGRAKRYQTREGIKVAVEDADTGGSAETQMEFDTADSAVPDPGTEVLTDSENFNKQTRVTASAGMARMGASPARSAMQAEVREMKDRLFDGIRAAVGRFLSGPDALVGVDADLAATATAEDVERAMKVLIKDRIPGVVSEEEAINLNKGKRAPFLELKESAEFKENVSGLVDEVTRSIVENYPELAVRYSLSDDEAQRLRKEDARAQFGWITTQAQAEGFADASALATDNLDRFYELGSQWRDEHPRESWKLGPKGAPSGMTAEAVADALDAGIDALPPVVQALFRAGKITVVQGEANLDAFTQADIKARRAQGRVRGLLSRIEDRIYLVADNLQDEADAVKALLHEAVGEWGIDQVLGDENWQELSDFLLTSATAEGLAQTYFGDKLENLSGAEKSETAREVLSHLAENDTVQPAFAQRVWDKLRAMLRQLGWVHDYTAADVAYIVRKARGHTALESADESEIGDREAARSPRYSVKKGYSGVPDSLMGFPRGGPSRGFDEQRYSFIQTVRVSWEDGDTFVDRVKGLNKEHALERARRNWPGGTVVVATEQEFADQEAAESPRFSLSPGEDNMGELLQFIHESMVVVRDVGRAYNVEKGGRAFFARVSEESTGIHKQLAAIIAENIAEDTRITLDPALSRDGERGRALPGRGAGEIVLDPTQPAKEFHAAALHEGFHIVFFQKFEAMRRGQADKLSDADRKTLETLLDLYDRALAAAPTRVRGLVNSDRTAGAKRAQFARWAASEDEETRNMADDWYGVLNIDEFVAEALTNNNFQARLDGIDASDVADPSAPGKKTSALRKFWDTVVRAVAGKKGIHEGSALHKAFVHSLDLLGRNDGTKAPIIFDHDAELGSLATRVRAIMDPKGRQEMKTNLLRSLQDRFIDLKQAQERITAARGIAALPDTENAYVTSELYHGRVGERLESFVEEYPEEIGRAIRGHKLTMAEVDRFLYARHAPERNAYIQTKNDRFNATTGGGSGMTTSTANRFMRAFRNAGKLAALNDVATRIDKMTQESLRAMRNGGLITKEQFDALSNRYQYYATLQGFENPEDGAFTDDIEGILPRVGNGFDIRGVEPKRAGGRKSLAADVLQNTVESAARVLIRVEKNRVGRSMANLIRNNPDPAVWEIAVPDYKEVPDKITGVVSRRIDPNWQQRDDIIAFKENGETKFFRFLDKEGHLARNWKNAGLAQQETTWGYLFQKIASFTRYKALVSTQYNPEFTVTNILRDVQTTLLNLSGPDLEAIRGDVVKNLPHAIRGLLSSLNPKFSGPLQALLATGGPQAQALAASFEEMSRRGGTIKFFGLQGAQENIASALTAVGEGKVRRAAAGIHKMVGDWNSVAENATRLAVFHSLRSNGVSPDQAAHAARNITVNFNRKGEAGVALNALWMFFNASVQSTARIIDAMKARGGKKAAWLMFKLMSLGFLQGALARMVGGDDEEDGRNRWDKVPDFVRHTNLVFMLPEGMRQGFSGVPGVGRFLSQDGSYLKIPMPYGYNWFVNIGSTMEKFAAGSITAAGAATDIAGAAWETWNPVGGAGNFFQQITPTFLRPVTDLSINKDYSGKPILPEDSPYDYAKPRHTRYFQSVNPVSKEITDSINTFFGGNDVRGAGFLSQSPEVLDYMLNYAAGSAGSFLQRVGSFGYQYGKSAEAGEVFPANSVPGFRRFFGQPSDAGTRQAYGQVRDAAKRAQDEVEMFVKSGEPKGAQQAAKENLAELSVVGLVEKVEKERVKLHKQMASLRESEKAGADEKVVVKALAALHEQDAALQKEVLRAYLDVKQKKLRERVDLGF